MAILYGYSDLEVSNNKVNNSSSLEKTFVCVEVLRPSQSNGDISSAVSLPKHTFTGLTFSKNVADTAGVEPATATSPLPPGCSVLGPPIQSLPTGDPKSISIYLPCLSC